ncbi:hypothetical protein [Legionella fallonii]|uniref:Uncharacterized protein n=1 Tax=Legionella fallonii LLAP-10 TaxID=1212491 RepID=A0A098G446_9GAMM|nr:hypothetical protein [Legionella fallonii]CEG57247.1 protein of unknown function [Legionella fallonii LLAP-10]
MTIEEILALIKLYPQDKDFKIKDSVFADLSSVINSHKDLIDLLEIYPNEKNFRIKDFIFANLEKHLKSFNEVRELVKLYPNEKNLRIKDFIFANLEKCIESINDVNELLKLYPHLKNFPIKEFKDFIVQNPQVLQAIPTPQCDTRHTPPPSQEAQQSSTSSISMQILGGFIAAIGCAAVAVAFTVLNAATLGIAGLVTAGLGIASILGGVGLFALGSCRNQQIATNEPPELSSGFAYR